MEEQHGGKMDTYSPQINGRYSVPVAVGQGKSCPEGSVGLGSGLILQVIL
jgi:hypothetical protein